MNIIDKAVLAVDPEKGLKRIHARHKANVLMSGYSSSGASTSKKSLMGWLYRGGSADEDIHDNLEILRQRSRDLFMNAPIAHGAIKQTRTNVIGSGLKLKAQIDYKYLGLTEEKATELKNTIEREFSIWADSNMCDAERIDNFYELQALAFTNALFSGDVLVMLPIRSRVGEDYDLRIQLIEADRLETPPERAFDERIQSGVEVNAHGELCAFHVRSTHPLGTGGYDTKYTRVRAYGSKTGRRNAFLLMQRERIGQKRGVPVLAPVIETLKQLSRYTEAELMAAVVSGMFTVFIERDGVATASPIGEMVPEEEQVDRNDQNSIELGNGAIIDLADGEKANAVTPGRPNTAFDGFVSSLCKQLGVGLGIPYEVLIMHFSSSYSASRGALLEAWKSFRTQRAWMSSDFCQPIYEEWFCEAVAKGKIQAPGFFESAAIRKAYTGAQWNGPTQGQLDPVKEVKAAQMRVEAGFSTSQKEAMELTGTDFFKNTEQIKSEKRAFAQITDGKSEVEKS